MEASKSVTFIPAKKRMGNTATAEERSKLRVAAYCRVSTDSEEQASSYEVQVEHYTQFIQKNPDGIWQAYLRTMGSVAVIPKNEISSTV